MKKAFYTLFAICFFSNINHSFAQTQTFVSKYGDNAMVSSGTVTEIDVNNDLSSTSNTPTEGLYWSVIDISNINSNLPLTGFCDNNNCYPPSVLAMTHQSSAYYNVASTSTSHLFEAQFTPSASTPAGTCSSIRVRVTDSSAAAGNYSKIYTFTACKNTLKVTTAFLSETDLQVYPNPATDNINIVVNDHSINIATASIYNLIGKVLKTVRVLDNNAKIDLENIPNGVYFLRLMNAEGQVVGARKFTRQ